MSSLCPICGSNCHSAYNGELHRFECPRCGGYAISDFAKDGIDMALALDKIGISQYRQMTSSSQGVSQQDLCIAVAQKCGKGGTSAVQSIISHAIRKGRNVQTITIPDIVHILKHNSLPTPGEQANNLLMLLGERLVSSGDVFNYTGKTAAGATELSGFIGSLVGSETADLLFLLRSLEKLGLLEVIYQPRALSDNGASPSTITLTLLGWQKFEELKRSVRDSRKAFVAMAFVNSDKDKGDYYFFQNVLLDQYLVPAAKEAGYDLSNPLGSNPKAGNIHARMEVEIRAARFVVAELSHHNNGAYWEAGFAKALGKPVIYMYNKDIGGHEKPHFDVGSDYIIFWESDKPEAAAEELQAVIGATLFGEAIPINRAPR